MTIFEIKVYFDTICPWCYIGHKIFERAVGLYQKTYPGGSSDDFNFTFLPYYLNPNDPEEGIPWAQKVAAKNGDERVNGIRTRLQRVGRANGIEFSFNSKIGKTRDSHRLVRHAPPEVRKALVEEIFRLHFEHDADITSHSDLTKAAVAVGMNKSDVEAFLGSDQGAEEVNRMAAEAKQAGVSGVPTIEINGHQVVGAEDASEFYETLVKAKEEA